ncbi:MAG: hypothetical protein VB858_04740, partial [Planctomycetaceae bacterium]
MRCLRTVTVRADLFAAIDQPSLAPDTELFGHPYTVSERLCECLLSEIHIVSDSQADSWSEIEEHT